MPKKKLYSLIVDALHDAKAKDIAVLDVRGISDFTDYMVIASGTSSRHVQSTADKVIEKLRGHGHRTSGVEGMDLGEWVLIDFGEAVVHVMRPQTRDFYNIEKLWSEGKPVKLGATAERKTKSRKSAV
ncbi:MAG: ribosome silencing factor [Gammaproteobacteria bacterium]|nr:MAG: ribosome silencing factor [Gammaproteobacteria bacterium]